MFTGIIEEIGTVASVEPRTAGSRLRIRAPLVCGDLREGDSVCVNGVCLTAVALEASSFAADAAPETLARSSLGSLRPGDPVNLERALLAASRLGGHIVQGHVDGAGEIVSLEPLGDNNWWLQVRVPAELQRYLVFKGSIAIDGISLTIARVEGDIVGVTIIPHTRANTTLRAKGPGDPVNLETDVLAKYVEKMLSTLDLTSRKLTVEGMLEQGF
ncbi:MAG: riboflavin synthase [Candidatus Solibacter usitatus]|nr:riboflavin synthase [Candidatus Solibacter usitatus]